MSFGMIFGMNFGRMRSQFGLFVLATLAAVNALAANDINCHPIGHPKLGGDVCIHSVDRNRNPDILYFFHGVDRKATDWQDRPEFQAMRDLWDKTERGRPTILSVSFGPRWFLKTGSPGMHELFVSEVMPKLEQEVGGLGQGRRLILGESMGGANAAMLYLRQPGLFQQAAFLCPALSTVSPFSVFDIVGYILRNKADGVLVWYFMGVARDLIGRPEEWPPNNPLDIARSALSPTMSPVYLSSSQNDEFGFFDGGQTLAHMALDAKAPFQWVPRPGRHCANHDALSLVQFFNGGVPPALPANYRPRPVAAFSGQGPYLKVPPNFHPPFPPPTYLPSNVARGPFNRPINRGR